MAHAVTLTLPDRLYEPVQRIAQATNQPLEAVLLTALQASLPPLDGLPADIASELASLEELSDDALERVLHEEVSEQDYAEIQELLDQNQAGVSTEADRERLTALEHTANRVMLRKARAAVLLRFRGRPVPAMDEMPGAATQAG
jgi:predicted transcriptional regulator